MRAVVVIVATLLASAPAWGQTILYTLTGDAPGDEFGAAVANVGDLDGDAVEDFAVGAPGAGAGVGRAELISGATGALLVQLLPSTTAAEAFGTTLSAIADIDDDGVRDIVVGAPSRPGGGVVYMLSGATGAVVWEVVGSANQTTLGASVSGTGDIDGDGYEDVLAGAPSGQPFGYPGDAVALSGRTGSPLASIQGEDLFDRFGSSVLGIDDVDGDGRADALVAAPQSVFLSSGFGYVHVWSPATANVLQTFSGDWWDDRFGTRVAFVGDPSEVVAPVIVASAAPEALPPDARRGYVRTFSSATFELQLDIVSEFEPFQPLGGTESDCFGCGLVGLADIDTDGRSDIALGASGAYDAAQLLDDIGRLLIYSGADGTVLRILLGPSPFSRFGASLASFAPAGGDPSPKLAVGAPGEGGHGVVRLYAIEPRPCADQDGDGWSDCGADCDDLDASRNPGIEELCDDVDDDCDGLVDEDFDDDGDGFRTCDGDCNDHNANVHPGAPETCNRIDDDCDGLADEALDCDADGYAVPDDCDDQDPAVNPGMTEICNFVDDDCDGEINEGFGPDADGDGWNVACGDCDDTNAQVNPWAFERLDRPGIPGVDDNCNGVVDLCGGSVEKDDLASAVVLLSPLLALGLRRRFRRPVR